MNRTTITAMLALVVLVTAFGGSAAFAQNAAMPGGRAEAAFKDIKQLQGTPADQLIPTMQFFEGSLGVGCNFCHLPDRAADTPVKTTARQMIQMVKAINKDNFKGQRTVTCNTCHRGQAEPAANPALATEKFNKVAIPNATEVQRSAIAEEVANLEQISVRELMKQLGGVVPGSETSGVVRLN